MSKSINFGLSCRILVSVTLATAVHVTTAHAQVVADDVVCAGCVQATDIANGTIGPNKLIPGSVNAATIANGSIGPNKLIPGSINTATIASNAIRSNKILDGAVQNADIADDAVDLAKLSPAVRQIISDLQAQVAAMQDLLAVVVVEDVGTDLNGDGVIEDIPVDLDGDGVTDAASEFLPTVRFEGVNVQVVNGDASQDTNSLNALGNLIVGYNEARTGASGAVALCSDGQFTGVTSCLANGRVWALSHKSGSHNLIVGEENAYSQTSGVLFGGGNAVNRQGAVVTGGRANVASGGFASVSGGDSNSASGTFSSVSGGESNRARALNSSVSGGLRNTANGLGVSMLGGNDIFVSPPCLWGGEGQIFGNGAC